MTNATQQKQPDAGSKNNQELLPPITIAVVLCASLIFALFHLHETGDLVLFFLELCVGGLLAFIGYAMALVVKKVPRFEGKLEGVSKDLGESSKKAEEAAKLSKTSSDKLEQFTKDIKDTKDAITAATEMAIDAGAKSNESATKIQALTEAIKENTERLNRAQDDLSASSSGMLQASALLMKILGEQKLEVERTEGKIPPGILLWPVSTDVDSWLDFITKAKDDAVKAVLTKIGESYFHEEIFDIQNQRLVTNSRNWTIFLYKAVKAMIDYIGTTDGDQVLHYYTVTPFDPYDALNCPDKESVIEDSEGKPMTIAFCYEVPFLGDYFSTFIRELVTSYASAVQHRRYILCYKDRQLLNSYPDKQRWKMSHEKICELASQDSVLDIPISQDCEISEEWLKTMKLAKTSDKQGDWQHVELEESVEKFRQALKKSVFRPIFPAKDSVTKDTNLEELVNKRLAKINEQIEEKKEQLAEKSIVGSEHWSKFTDILRDIDVLKNCKARRFLNILDVSQKILSSKEAAGARETFKELVTLMKHKRSVLRYQEYCKDKGTYAHRLISYFIESFHSSEKDARFVHLETHHARHWEKEYKYIPPEFAMFGIAARNEQIGNVNWLMAMTSSIEFPWKSSEIEFIFRTQDEKEGTEANKRDVDIDVYRKFLIFLDNIK